MAQELLFSKYSIFGVIQGQTEALKKKIQEINPAVLLNASEQDLVDALMEEFRLNVPVVKDSELYIADSGEAQVDVSRDPMRLFLDRSRPFYIPGNKIVIAAPFDGDAEFFRIQPQSHTLNPPRGEIVDHEIHLTYISTDQKPEVIKQQYEAALHLIRENLTWLRESTSQFNSQLEGQIRSQLKARKDRLLADAGMTAALGLPMKKRESLPTTYAVPVTRRVLKIEEIRVTNDFKPEPVLSTEDYEEILRIMRSMVRVMELSPHAFRDMGEEDLRSHFLVQLNGAFHGGASGETFNFQGKTDILIRVNGRNIFIAECKFWTGEKGFLETIDQLLSYLSWRDTKAAILIFNRNAGFSAVLTKIANAAKTHKHFKRDLGRSDESTFRYVFSQPTDKNREITLTVLAFDVPTERGQNANSN
jgi:hypothetical protein